MKAVIYARYSAGPRQTDQSIEGQLRVCTDFCKQREITVVDTYCDRHISGRTDERPEFQRLIADAKQKKFEAVVVYKTDRFARNKYDSAIYKRELKRNGVQIFYAGYPRRPRGNYPRELDGRPRGILLRRARPKDKKGNARERAQVPEYRGWETARLLYRLREALPD